MASVVPQRVESPKPLCPVCHKGDQVQKLQAAYAAGVERLAPPAMPVSTASMSNSIVIGMSIVGVGVFFIIVLIGSESGAFGADISIPLLILVGVTLVAIVIALVLSFMAFQHVLRQDEVSQERFPLWDEALEHYRRLYYCARDNEVFDLQANKTLSEEALASLLSTEIKHAKEEPTSASLAHS